MVGTDRQGFGVLDQGGHALWGDEVRQLRRALGGEVGPGAAHHLTPPRPLGVKDRVPLEVDEVLGAPLGGRAHGGQEITGVADACSGAP